MLAAGGGLRLRPLTRLRPKALCPVGDRPLVDHALARLVPLTGEVAVNAHHGIDQMVAHLEGRVVLSVEQFEPLGTAGGLGRLRPWIDGRAALVTNADAWLTADLHAFVAGWDGERVRLLCVEEPGRGDFGTLRYCGVALLPWTTVSALPAVPSGLYEASWRSEHDAGRLDLVVHHGSFVDCGTPLDYLAANLACSGGRSVVGEGAVIGSGAVLERAVVWPAAVVHPGEVLVDAIRADDLTVLVR